MIWNTKLKLDTIPSAWVTKPISLPVSLRSTPVTTDREGSTSPVTVVVNTVEVSPVARVVGTTTVGPVTTDTVATRVTTVIKVNAVVVFVGRDSVTVTPVTDWAPRMSLMDSTAFNQPNEKDSDGVNFWEILLPISLSTHLISNHDNGKDSDIVSWVERSVRRDCKVRLVAVSNPAGERDSDGANYDQPIALARVSRSLTVSTTFWASVTVMVSGLLALIRILRHVVQGSLSTRVFNDTITALHPSNHPQVIVARDKGLLPFDQVTKHHRFFLVPDLY